HPEGKSVHNPKGPAITELDQLPILVYIRPHLGRPDEFEFFPDHGC
ncbi:unnamed protein product, partial [marine sediment metagenome]